MHVCGARMEEKEKWNNLGIIKREMELETQWTGIASCEVMVRSQPELLLRTMSESMATQ